MIIEYEELFVFERLTLYKCSFCGGLAVNREYHTKHHEDFVQLERSVREMRNKVWNRR